MTTLERLSLIRLPMTKEEVEKVYDLADGVPVQRLCESHERQRSELEGAEQIIAELEDKIVKALAMTDTGSEDFRYNFPPKSAGESLNPRDIVPGWRVVERIRELLL